MSNKAELITMIQDWLDLDKEIKTKNTQLRQLRSQKKAVSDELIKVMKDNEIGQIDVNAGKIVCSTRKARSALNKKLLVSALSEYFKETGDTELPSELAAFIMDKRPVKEIDTVKIRGS